MSIVKGSDNVSPPFYCRGSDGGWGASCSRRLLARSATTLNHDIIELWVILGTIALGGYNTFTGLSVGSGTLDINNGGSATTNSALGTGALTLAKAGSGRYRPTTDDGQPVTACYSYRVRFKLD